MNNSTILYPKPDGVDASPDYIVRVNGRESFVYACSVASYTLFSFDAAGGAVTVEIIPRVTPVQTVIRPLERGIVADIVACMQFWPGFFQRIAHISEGFGVVWEGGPSGFGHDWSPRG